MPNKYSKNICPNFLKKGDKVIIVSPSGNIETEYVYSAKKQLENWGLTVKIAPHALNKIGRFCGSIEERLSDLQTAMDDPDCKLISCSRGGYGVVHLLDSLDFTHIKQYPKWLIGYSDITALHLAFLQNNLVSLHAPMAKHMAEEGEKDIAVQYLKNLLFGNIPQYVIASHELNINGTANGVLFGGNLAVLCGLIGSKYTILPESTILFIEDIGESPYKIDRMIWTLKLSGILSQIKGFIVGCFSDYEEDPSMYNSVYESIKKLCTEYNIPLVFNFPVGHVKENFPLLHGSNTTLIVDEKETKLKFNL